MSLYSQSRHVLDNLFGLTQFRIQLFSVSEIAMARVDLDQVKNCVRAHAVQVGIYMNCLLDYELEKLRQHRD